MGQVAQMILERGEPCDCLSPTLKAGTPHEIPWSASGRISRIVWRSLASVVPVREVGRGLAAGGCSAECQRSHGEQGDEAAVAKGGIPESDVRGQ